MTSAVLKAARKVGWKHDVVECFFNVDLRKGHQGLADVAADFGLPISALRPGQFVAFVNHSKTAVKIYGTYNSILYVKADEGRKITPDFLAKLPRVFGEETRPWSFAAKVRSGFSSEAGQVLPFAASKSKSKGAALNEG